MKVTAQGAPATPNVSAPAIAAQPVAALSGAATGRDSGAQQAGGRQPGAAAAGAASHGVIGGNRAAGNDAGVIVLAQGAQPGAQASSQPVTIVAGSPTPADGFAGAGAVAGFRDHARRRSRFKAGALPSAESVFNPGGASQIIAARDDTGGCGCARRCKRFGPEFAAGSPAGRSAGSGQFGGRCIRRRRDALAVAGGGRHAHRQGR